MRQLRLLDKNGDIVITWTQEHDDAIESIIEKKMAEGMSFFILEPQAGGLLPPTRTKLTSAKNARTFRALAIDDPDFSAFIGAGKGEMIDSPVAPIKTTRRAKTAKEVVGFDTLGLKPRKSG